jgi:hypothetical protein
MAQDILSNETYILKLTKTDSKNLARFCMITPPIFDVTNTFLKQIKEIEFYLKEWQELEKSISDIIKNINKDVDIS